MSPTANAAAADDCGCCEFTPPLRDVVKPQRRIIPLVRMVAANRQTPRAAGKWRHAGGTPARRWPAKLPRRISSNCKLRITMFRGGRLPHLANDARCELLAAAKRYTKAYRDVDVPCSARVAFLAGHQPEMFHPGVWFKNFLLAGLAKQHQAVAVNLQIDSDAMKGTAVRVPGGTLEQPRIEAVAFDRATSHEPFEQRTILDPARFESFGQRLRHSFGNWCPIRCYRVLAAGRGTVKGNEQFGRMHRASPASIGRPLAIANIGSAAKPGLRFAGDALVHRSFAGALAAAVGHL